MVQFVPVIVLSRGPKHLLLACSYDLDVDKPSQFPTRADLRKGVARKPVVIEFPVLELRGHEKPVNESGAGDSMSSGIIYGILQEYTCAQAIYNGILSAKMALLTSDNVSENLGSIELSHVEDLVAANRPNIKKHYL